MSTPHEIFRRTILTKSPSVTFEDVRRVVCDKMVRYGIQDEITAIVHRENGWEITFGKKTTAEHFIKKGIWTNIKCNAYSLARFNYLMLTLSGVPAYLPDECITKELVRLNCQNVGKPVKIQINGIENGERRVPVYIDSKECSLPERIVLEFEGKLEPVRISNYKPMVFD